MFKVGDLIKPEWNLFWTNLTANYSTNYYYYYQEETPRQNDILIFLKIEKRRDGSNEMSVFWNNAVWTTNFYEIENYYFKLIYSI